MNIDKLPEDLKDYLKNMTDDKYSKAVAANDMLEQSKMLELNGVKTTKQTLGQYRVGISFNPSNNSTVDLIKSKCADLIDIIENLKFELDSTVIKDGEFIRLASHAQTLIEDAAMNAVKCATKSKRN